MERVLEDAEWERKTHEMGKHGGVRIGQSTRHNGTLKGDVTEGRSRDRVEKRGKNARWDNPRSSNPKCRRQRGAGWGSRKEPNRGVELDVRYHPRLGLASERNDGYHPSKAKHAIATAGWHTGIMISFLPRPIRATIKEVRNMDANPQ